MIKISTSHGAVSNCCGEKSQRMELCLSTSTDPITRRAGLSASAELLVGVGN